ncbi:MAG: NAD(P)/FAD-dependent oxidoreductase [Pseudomonadota bacterium]
MQNADAKTANIHDVVIVGAGAAGIGMAMALKNIPSLHYTILERERIGESFRGWPAQTKFITPSFNSNSFGLADLNAVDASSSPAKFSGSEHLSGSQYAEYLSFIADSAKLDVMCGVEVQDVYPGQLGGFRLFTEQGEINTRFLIWACGEYQFPDLEPFTGGKLCLHYAQVDDWSKLQSGHYSVIGGYESAIDAAFNLLKQGHSVRLLIRQPTWDTPEISDPSLVLSPYSRERLRLIEASDKLEIVSQADIVEVSKKTANGFRIHAADGRHWDTIEPPVLGTGFMSGGGARQIAHLWQWGNNGHVKLSEIDESTITPGLFLIGPQVRQNKLIYCFIYKFRQRFAAIASEISHRLMIDSVTANDSENAWGPFGNTECCEDCEC